MPNRILRDWTDSFTMNGLDVHAERLFLRLIMRVDDFGRYHADPRLVKASCFPLKNDVRDADIIRWLAACQEAGVIRRYADDRGREYLEILNFKQRSRAAESKYPEPPPLEQPEGGKKKGRRRAPDGPMTVLCPSTDRQMTVTCPTPAHVFGDGDVCEDEGEGGDADALGDGDGSAGTNGAEPVCENKNEYGRVSRSVRKSGSMSESAPESVDSTSVVETIVAAYPRKDSPMEARQSVERAIHSGENALEILTAVRDCAKLINSAPGGSGNRYVPTARNFFAQRQWSSPEAFRHRWQAKASAGEHGGETAGGSLWQREGEIPTDVSLEKVKRLGTPCS